MPDIAERLTQFREVTMPNVEGWLGSKIVDVLEIAAAYQAERNIRGHALEIGVYHGRFFLALMAAIEESEVAVAADIFDAQELNIDHSGTGTTFEVFNRNVSTYGANKDALRLLAGDSMVLRAEDVLAKSDQGKFRFISVDGGHTAEHVMNDLGLAADLIAGGGVIFLDDFLNPHWPGVHEGYVRYMLNANRNLAPVIYTENKLMLTTISHQPQLVDFMRRNYVASPGCYLAEVSSVGFKYISSN